MSAPSPAAKLVRLASVSAALALLAALIVRPALGPVGARAMGELPDCRYDDILTTPRGYGDWSITLVDTILRLPKSYAPPDLVRVVNLGVPGRGKVRAVIAEDLKAMSDAAAAANAAIAVSSAYRSYADQQAVFRSWVARYGYKRALQISARPGHSEHQLGVTIDFRSQPDDGGELATSWAGTPAGKWMKAHAWEYGFLMSYPKGTMALTCYDWEPWHFRYVGRELAAKIHASGLTPREYLWAHFTTTVVPPPPPPTHAPTKTARPSAAPTAAPSVAPSPSPTALPTIAPETIAPPSASPAPTSSPATPAGSARPVVPQAPAAGFEPAVLAGGVVVLGTTVLGLLFAIRRGRSGAGL
ncbi:MAG TPA: D-alanyl-D-alanine carboxypeptidase family protein [Candidatus Limnocylindrales bacterium]